MRPAHGERQARLGRPLGRRRHRQPVVLLALGGQEARRRRRHRLADRRAVQGRVSASSARNVGAHPVRDVREEHAQGEDRGIVYPQIPGIAENGVAIANAMKKAGCRCGRSRYDPNTTDLVGPITAAGGQSVDVFVLQDVAAGCVNMAKALTSLGLNAEGADEPALPRPARGCGSRRRLPEVDVRDRIVARVRPDRQGRAALPQGLQEVRAGPEDHG